MTSYHCQNVDHARGTSAVCPADAVVVWRDQDNVGHGFCLDHLRVGHIESVKRAWTVDEGSKPVLLGIMEGKAA